MNIRKASNEEGAHPGRFLVVGIAVGVAVGAALGYPGVGIAVGVAMALILGYGMNRRR